MLKRIKPVTILGASLLAALLLALFFTRSLPGPGAESGAPSQGVLPQIASAQAPNNNEPLINRNAYNDASDVDLSVEELYITTYPTYNEEGRLITREEFNKHQPRVRDFNPVLNAHIWQGHPDDPVGIEKRLGFTDAKYNCTIRVRGNSTRGALAKSFKVKLTEPGASLFSADSLNINKHYSEETRTESKICMDLMQMIPSGIVSLQTRFVRLYINDVMEDGSETGFVDQGLYVWIEQPNRDWLKNHGLDLNGTVYKSNTFEFAVHSELRAEDDPLYNEAEFNEVLEPVANPNHAKLIRMLEDINNLSLDYRQVFDVYFDEENYLTWMALNILFGMKDTLTHNLLLYSPSNSEKWFLLPWDYDGALAYSDVDQWGDRFFQQFGIHYFWTLPIHQRYFRIEGNIDKLITKMDELLATVLTRENFETLNSGYMKVLDEYAIRYPDILWIPYEKAYNAISLRYQAMLNNRERFELTLQYPSTIFIQEPTKVEDGWLFQWDAAFDHQRDPVTYEIILSTGYEAVTKGGMSFEQAEHEQTGIFFRQAGLKGTQIIVPELPEGPVYYRVLTTDAQGHVQYPRNDTFIMEEGNPNPIESYHAIGLYINERK